MVKKILYILLFISSVCFGQTYEVTNLFMQDSMKLGTSANSIFIDTIKAGSIVISWDGLDYTMDGSPQYIPLDSLAVFNVSAQGNDTAVVDTAIGFDGVASNYQLRYSLDGYPTISIQSRQFGF